MFLLPLSSNIISFKERFSFSQNLILFILADANVQPFYSPQDFFFKKITFIKHSNKYNV
uniref:Uncharacterized protein n=1 Tax=uncultured Sphingobacteriales bacterium HF0010_19H17 TaxID=710990 RepID=E0XRD9_9SPHI|nr:hypothetical protein [uncultured Sphingobacteriales bacterium HF0010_19H17]